MILISYKLLFAWHHTCLTIALKSVQAHKFKRSAIFNRGNHPARYTLRVVIQLLYEKSGHCCTTIPDALAILSGNDLFKHFFKKENIMIKKTLMILFAAAFIATPVYAGNVPEFDAVGCDATNYFNDDVRNIVAAVNANSMGVNLNLNSVFPYDIIFDWGEYYETNAGDDSWDTCFPGYISNLIDCGDGAVYEWQIVLQLKPKTDLDLKIRDCVLECWGTKIFGNAGQASRFRTLFGDMLFLNFNNPSLTVTAKSGPKTDFADFSMDARLHPTLALVALNDVLYTSKALWTECIVLALPLNGESSTSGVLYNFYLREGDQIHVKIDIPITNSSEIRYASDNVVIEYVGMSTMSLTGLECER